MFNGSLIEELFAVVKKAEKSARPALPQEIQPRGASNEPMADCSDRQEANSEAK